MNNFWIVVGREYMTRVKKKSFIILTILMPFLMAALVFVPMLLGMIKDSDAQKQVVVIDKTERYLPLFLEAQKTDSTKAEGYVFVAGAGDISLYNNEEMDIAAVVNITDTLTTNPKAVRIYSRGEVQHDLQRYVEDILNRQIYKDKMLAYGIPQLDQIVDDLQQSLSIQTVKWGDNGEETFSSGEIAMVIGMLTAFLIYMFVLSYGAMVMQGVMEEKTNRIVEVIVGSVKPFHLMMGKIVGILFVGLTQIVIWGTMLTALIIIGGVATGASSMDSESVKQAVVTAAEARQQGAMVQAQAMPELPADSPAAELLTAFHNLPLAEIGILFILFFLGGYMLYASFYAAIGAAINSQEDSSQFMMPVMIVMVFSIYAAMGSMENTDGPLAFWASMFPLSSPIVMMVRLPFGVPLWQEILSVALLFATALLFVWISARIYRVGILMYGKKPTLKDMIKWLKY